MGRIRKSPSVTLFLITVFTSLMLIGSVSSQSIPKPSVPTFTLSFQDNSYTILPRIMRTTDPYTGVQTRSNTTPIYVQNKTIQVTITNQPFAPYTDSNGNTIGLVYDVRYKGHYSSTWWSLSPHVYFNQSNSATTEIPVAFAGNYDQTGGIASLNGNPTPDVKIDFQVQALTGYIELLNGLYNFTGESSGWSSTKTITTIETATSASPTSTPKVSSPTPTIYPTSTPAVPEFSWLMILPFFLSILFIVVLIRKRNHLK
jgi:hypothetical protein